MRYFLLFIFLFIFLACAEKKEDFTLKPIEQLTYEDITVDVFDYNSLKPILKVENDTTYVINFWATWCAPCVKELPHFEALNEKYKNKKLKVILVSLDFKSKIEDLLIPFLVRKQLKSKVILLSDSNADYWINEINPNWSGALPATIIKKGNSLQFFEKDFEFEELDKLVSETINQ